MSARRRGPTGQRGAALLIVATLITTAIVLAAFVAGMFSSSELRGDYESTDSLQAFMAAETGIQRAGRRFMGGTACTAAGLGESGVAIAYPAGVNITISVKTLFDFNGVTALTALQCRIEVTATVTASSATRTIQAILDKNLINTGANANFNLPGGAAPTGWTLGGTSEGGFFKTLGGPEGVASACNTSIYDERLATAIRTTTGTRTTSFRIPATATLANINLVVDWRMNGEANANNRLTSLTLTDSGATARAFNFIAFGTNAALGVVPVANPPNPTCSTGYTLNGTSTISVSTAAVVNPITTTAFVLTLRSIATDGELWMDNIEITSVQGFNALRVYKWRECIPGTGNCPA
jgi:hypothetical protein